MITIDLDMAAFSDLAKLDLSPGALVEIVGDMVLEHHALAWQAGDKPAGGRQPPLDPKGQRGKSARAGHRPDVRGNKGGAKPMPRMITRSKVSLQKTGASCTIRAGRKGQERFILLDQKNGSEFFAIGGKVRDVIDRGIMRYLELLLSGRKPRPTGKIKRGRDIR